MWGQACLLGHIVPCLISGEVIVETKLSKKNSTKRWATVLCHSLGPQAHMKQKTTIAPSWWRLFVPELCIVTRASYSVPALAPSSRRVLDSCALVKAQDWLTICYRNKEEQGCFCYAGHVFCNHCPLASFAFVLLGDEHCIAMSGKMWKCSCIIVWFRLQVRKKYTVLEGPSQTDKPTCVYCICCCKMYFREAAALWSYIGTAFAHCPIVSICCTWFRNINSVHFKF